MKGAGGCPAEDGVGGSNGLTRRAGPTNCLGALERLGS